MFAYYEPICAIAIGSFVISEFRYNQNMYNVDSLLELFVIIRYR